MAQSRAISEFADRFRIDRAIVDSYCQTLESYNWCVDSAAGALGSSISRRRKKRGWTPFGIAAILREPLRLVKSELRRFFPDPDSHTVKSPSPKIRGNLTAPTDELRIQLKRYLPQNVESLEAFGKRKRRSSLAEERPHDVAEEGSVLKGEEIEDVIPDAPPGFDPRPAKRHRDYIKSENDSLVKLEIEDDEYTELEIWENLRIDFYGTPSGYVIPCNDEEWLEYPAEHKLRIDYYVTSTGCVIPGNGEECSSCYSENPWDEAEDLLRDVAPDFEHLSAEEQEYIGMENDERSRPKISENQRRDNYVTGHEIAYNGKERCKPSAESSNNSKNTNAERSYGHDAIRTKSLPTPYILQDEKLCCFTESMDLANQAHLPSYFVDFVATISQVQDIVAEKIPCADPLYEVETLVRQKLMNANFSVKEPEAEMAVDALLSYVTVMHSFQKSNPEQRDKLLHVAATEVATLESKTKALEWRLSCFGSCFQMMLNRTKLFTAELLEKEECLILLEADLVGQRSKLPRDRMLSEARQTVQLHRDAVAEARKQTKDAFFLACLSQMTLDLLQRLLMNVCLVSLKPVSISS